MSDKLIRSYRAGVVNIDFPVILSKDADENCWVAVIKFNESSVASQGRTIEKALENVKEALELYMEVDEYSEY